MQMVKWDLEVSDGCVEGLAVLSQRCTRSHWQMFANYEHKLIWQ